MAAAMQPACAEYAGFLKSLMTQPYAVQAAAFWAMEACYNQVEREGQGQGREGRKGIGKGTVGAGEGRGQETAKEGMGKHARAAWWYQGSEGLL